jgi:5-methylcytosine-specific restriction endonuclease McrA
MDYSKYHPDWKDIIRPAILKRDGYKCAHCGIKHKARVYKDTTGKYVECDEFMEQWAKSTKRKVFTLYLQVAHLDHNKHNNEPTNLKALCPIHHARFDSEHKKLARIMYKQKITSAKQVPDVRKTIDRGALLSTVRDSIRTHIGSRISLIDAEAILNDLLTSFEAFKKQ